MIAKNDKYLRTEQCAKAFYLKKPFQTNNGCILWTGCKGHYGYGVVAFTIPGENVSRRVLAHRASYFFSKGSLSQEMTLDHLCRNRLCINVEHLEEVSNSENIRRGVAFRKPFDKERAKLRMKEWRKKNRIRLRKKYREYMHTYYLTHKKNNSLVL